MTKTEREIGRNFQEEGEEQEVIGPEGYLLARVFDEEPSPIPRKFEAARRKAISEALTLLEENERLTLDLRFGLSDGLPRSLMKVGEEVGLRLRRKPYSKERPRQIEAKALRKLRHPRIGSELVLFLSLQEGSLGQSIWGIQLGYELTQQFPQVDFTHATSDDLNLSQETREELAGIEGVYRFFGKGLALRTMIREIPTFPLSDSAVQELRQSLNRLNDTSTFSPYG